MLKGLLNPKKQIQSLLKNRLPKLRSDLSGIIEDLLTQVADNNEENPFELVLILSEKKGVALGRVFDKNKQCLQELNAGKIIKDLFKKQLESIPVMLRGYIEEKLEGEDVGQMVVDSLKGKAILIHYGEDTQLIFVEVTKKDKKILDLDNFFNNLEI